MKIRRKWWKLALIIVALVIAAQVCVSLLVRTRRMHAYLTAQLGRSFGRPVDVGAFDVQLLPTPRFDAERVTVWEDPAFGNEYFLRADTLSASLRWAGLLRGHFQFGTLSFSRPSLVLVRNAQGRWNLERWLPPAKSVASSTIYGPPTPAAPVNRLWRIEFDEGRIDFKNIDEKLAFALLDVSGSVDQVAAGRWQLQLKAQPWRSGAVLQSAGTLRVQGDIAGTSARLQPARIAVHWEEVSLADLFRLIRGRDYGIRGVFNLDGSLKSGTAGEAVSAETAAGVWSFSVDARAAQVHRWDLGERKDNPRLKLGVHGHWDVGAGTVRTESIVLEGPASNLRGTANYTVGPLAPKFEARIESAGIQASDLLAWYRAFYPGVDDAISAEQFFTGAASIRGWPIQLQDAGFSSNGGLVRVPGLKTPVRIGAVRGGRQRGSLTLEPVRVALSGLLRDVQAPKKRRIATVMDNAADITIEHNLETHSGSFSIEGHVQKTEDVLKVAAAFGHPLNHGWELAGDVTAVAHWDWQSSAPGRWNGRVLLNKAKLAVVGLNQPLDVQAGTLNWKDGLRSVDVTKVNGFGGAWSGSIEERSPSGIEDRPRWSFNLTADRMNAGDLDHWVGPRARPNWLKGLLSSLLGGSSPTPAASDLVRQMNAEGQLQIGELTIERLKLSQVRASGSLHDLKLNIQDGEAQWGSGSVHAQISAEFAPVPQYEVTARVDGVKLTEMPFPGRFLERLAGTASGDLRVTTEGVGREELLQNLTGGGDLQFRNVEFRGWDVNASVTDGAPQTGTSRWTSGRGTFTMRNRNVAVKSLTLDSGSDALFLRGTVSFARDADLTIQSSGGAKRSPSARLTNAGRVLKISGPLDGPRVSVEEAAARQPAD